MSEENKLEPAARISFIRGKDDPHELASLLKELKKNSKKALTAIVKIVEDDSVDPKLRQQAADSILDKTIQIADIIAKEDMSRLVAEVKMTMPQLPSGKMKEVSSDEESETVKPIVDFSSVMKI